MPTVHLSPNLISSDCNHRSSQGQTLSDAIVRTKALVKLWDAAKGHDFYRTLTLPECPGSDGSEWPQRFAAHSRQSALSLGS